MALDSKKKCDFDAMKANFEVALVFSIVFVKKINTLKQQVWYEKRTWLQIQGKWQIAKVECLLYDAKVVECEKLYANSVMGLKLAQEPLTKLIE